MPVIKLSMSQLVRHQQALGEQWMPAVRRGLLSGAQRVVVTLQKSTRAAGAVDTGAYLRAWRATEVAEGVMVSNSAPYSGVIEHGRRAGSRMPPLREIERWAQRRLGLDAKTARQAAFPIAKAIARRGLRPRLVMTSKLEEMTRMVMLEVKKEIGKMLGKR